MKASKNRVKEEFEKKFRNKPVGSRLIFGHKSDPFPQHGYKYDPPAKKKISHGSYQRNFYKYSPVNNFMQVGRPESTIYASLLLGYRTAVLNAENLDATRQIQTAEENGVLIPKNSQFTGQDMSNAFRSGLERRQYFIELARAAKKKLRLSTRGQPKLDEDLINTFRSSALLKTVKPTDYEAKDRTSKIVSRTASSGTFDDDDLVEETIVLKPRKPRKPKRIIPTGYDTVPDENQGRYGTVPFMV